MLPFQNNLSQKNCYSFGWKNYWGLGILLKYALCNPMVSSDNTGDGAQMQHVLVVAWTFDHRVADTYSTNWFLVSWAETFQSKPISLVPSLIPPIAHELLSPQILLSPCKISNTYVSIFALPLPLRPSCPLGRSQGGAGEPWAPTQLQIFSCIILIFIFNKKTNMILAPASPLSEKNFFKSVHVKISKISSYQSFFRLRI